MPESKTLFDDAADWRGQPLVAFAAFVRSAQFVELGMRRRSELDGNVTAPLQASSANVYLRMFGAVVRWLTARSKTIYDITPEDLALFLEHSDAPGSLQSNDQPSGIKRRNSAIRIRYLRLIERVLTHLQVRPNPAQYLCFAIYRQRQRGMAGRDAAKAVLTDREQTAFMAALPGASESAPAQASWKRRRDRAMQALMLGAGLKVSEVLALRINQVGMRDAAGSVPIALDSGAANHVTRAHRTQLRPFAAVEVLAWVASRKAECKHSQLLFPTTPDSNLLLHPATVYRQVKATFERAGIDPKRWGGRTLRNTFAVRELVETGSTELVGEFLGHRLQRSTLYYQQAANQRTAAAAHTRHPVNEDSDLAIDRLADRGCPE